MKRLFMHSGHTSKCFSLAAQSTRPEPKHNRQRCSPKPRQLLQDLPFLMRAPLIVAMLAAITVRMNSSRPMGPETGWRWRLSAVRNILLLLAFSSTRDSAAKGSGLWPTLAAVAVAVGASAVVCAAGCTLLAADATCRLLQLIALLQTSSGLLHCCAAGSMLCC